MQNYSPDTFPLTCTGQFHYVGWSGSRAAGLAPCSPAPHHEAQLPHANTTLPSPHVGNEDETMKSKEETLKHWSIYIDIEGFSNNYRDGGIQRGRVLNGLRSLMEGIHGIGTKVCIERKMRLCAYQAGDAFFIDSGYGTPDVPIAIAITLMRSALLAGALTKAGISEGDCVDIRSLRPEVIRESAKGDDVPLGKTGHMRLFPVMGTAYICAHKLTTKAKGCLLLLDNEMVGRSSVKSTHHSDFGCNVIDWIHADFPAMHQIAEAATIAIGHRTTLEGQLKRLASEAAAHPFPGSEQWLAHTLAFNRCE